MNLRPRLSARTLSNVGTTVLAAAFMVTIAGCPGDGGGDTPCGDATITGSADANNVFTTLTATQCDIAFTTDGLTLSIDILERMDEGASPRILFTLDDVSSIPADQTISLVRDNDTDLAPGVYQEFTGPAPEDMSLADGPFWSSNSGSITFSTDATTGDVTATFNFGADNPRPDNPSTATGTVTVNGSLLVAEGSGGSSSGCGAFGPGGIAPMMLILLGLTLGKLRVRRPRQH